MHVPLGSYALLVVVYELLKVLGLKGMAFDIEPGLMDGGYLITRYGW
jgi:hypothetical protein